MIKKIKHWAKQLKKQLTALYFARKHPHTPWYCQWLIILTLVYALSPVDLIPDFIPLLGLLDDLLLLPLVIYITIRLLPDQVWQDSLLKAEKTPLRLPRQKAGIVLFVVFWSLMALLVLLLLEE